MLVAVLAFSTLANHYFWDDVPAVAAATTAIAATSTLVLRRNSSIGNETFIKLIPAIRTIIITICLPHLTPVSKLVMHLLQPLRPRGGSNSNRNSKCCRNRPPKFQKVLNATIKIIMTIQK